MAKETNGTDGGDGSTASSEAPGWCYLTGGAAGGRSQSIAFSSTEVPEAGAPLWLACPEAAANGPDASAPAGDVGAQDASPPEFVVGFSSPSGACLASALPVDPGGNDDVQDPRGV
jgi:hypothetical protein